MANSMLGAKLAKPTRAWLLEWPDQPLALAACEVVEILDAPEIHAVPFGPEWCRGMVVWHDQLLALAVPEGALREHAEGGKQPLTVVIVALQARPMTPLLHAAIGVSAHPKQIDVADGLDCELPLDYPLPIVAARACFQFEGRTIVVPELAALFGPSAA